MTSFPPFTPFVAMNHLWYVGVILIPFRIFGDKQMSLTHPPFAETVRKNHDGDPALPVWITRQYVQKWLIKKLVGWKTLHKTGHTQPTVTQLDSLLSVYHSLSKLNKFTKHLVKQTIPYDPTPSFARRSMNQHTERRRFCIFFYSFGAWKTDNYMVLKIYNTR
jgi:hypothetical protein